MTAAAAWLTLDAWTSGATAGDEATAATWAVGAASAGVEVDEPVLSSVDAFEGSADAALGDEEAGEPDKPEPDPPDDEPEGPTVTLVSWSYEHPAMTVAGDELDMPAA